VELAAAPSPRRGGVSEAGFVSRRIAPGNGEGLTGRAARSDFTASAMTLRSCADGRLFEATIRSGAFGSSCDGVPVAAFTTLRGVSCATAARAIQTTIAAPVSAIAA
jgi:hypothetical protein